LRRYLSKARKNRMGHARSLSHSTGVLETRISEVLHGKRARFSVADAARLTVRTEIPLEILLGLDLKRVTCPACGWSVLRRRGTRLTLAHHYWLCPRRGRSTAP
jgi:hypothetical protein